jgi:hypothetical protein|eukprot:8478015-Pyramimonas_sp.AAC.1
MTNSARMCWPLRPPIHVQKVLDNSAPLLTGQIAAAEEKVEHARPEIGRFAASAGWNPIWYDVKKIPPTL